MVSSLYRGAMNDAKGNSVTMTDATSAVRTYAVGDRSDEYSYHTTHSEWCGHTGDWDNGRTYYRCSIKAGHGGPQHVAANEVSVVATKARDETAPATVEGTWKIGDNVRSTPGATRQIAVGTVVDVTERDGIARVDLVGRYMHDEGNWQHLQVDATALEPAVTGYTPPTVEQMGRALASTARQAQTLIEAAQRDRDRAQAEHGRLNAEYQQFRDTVRDKAIEYATRHGWCRVVDEALEEMGLPPRTRDFTVQVTVTATQTVSVTVEATDEEAARNAVDSSDVRYQIDSSEWSWDYSDWEIDDVTED